MSKNLEQKIERLERENAYYQDCLITKNKFHDESTITLDQIVNSINANIYWKDLSGRFLGMNKNNLAMLGQDIEYSDVIGKTDADFEKSSRYGEIIHLNDLNIINNNISSSFEEEYISDYEDAIYLSTKSCLKDDNGTTIGLVGVSIDITEQKKLQTDLEEKIELLKNRRQTILDTKESLLTALIALK